MSVIKNIPSIFKRRLLFNKLDISFKSCCLSSDQPSKSPALVKGSSVTVTRTIYQSDIDTFASLTGDHNPIHVSQFAAASHPRKLRGCVVHGALLNGLVSGLLGTVLPGPGTLVLEQHIKYPASAYAGEEVSVTVTLTDVRKIVTASFECVVNRATDSQPQNSHSHPKNDVNNSTEPIVVLHGKAKLLKDNSS